MLEDEGDMYGVANSLAYVSYPLSCQLKEILSELCAHTSVNAVDSEGYTSKTSLPEISMAAPVFPSYQSSKARKEHPQMLTVRKFVPTCLEVARCRAAPSLRASIRLHTARLPHALMDQREREAPGYGVAQEMRRRMSSTAVSVAGSGGLSNNSQHLAGSQRTPSKPSETGPINIAGGCSSVTPPTSSDTTGSNGSFSHTSLTVPAMTSRRKSVYVHRRASAPCSFLSSSSGGDVSPCGTSGEGLSRADRALAQSVRKQAGQWQQATTARARRGSIMMSAGSLDGIGSPGGGLGLGGGRRRSVAPTPINVDYTTLEYKGDLKAGSYGVASNWDRPAMHEVSGPGLAGTYIPILAQASGTGEGKQGGTQPITAMCPVTDGLVVGDADGALGFYRVPEFVFFLLGSGGLRDRPKRSAPPSGHFGCINVIVASSDGHAANSGEHRVVWSGGSDCNIVRWSQQGAGSGLWTPDLILHSAHDKPVQSLTYDRRLKLVISGASGSLRAWSVIADQANPESKQPVFAQVVSFHGMRQLILMENVLWAACESQGTVAHRLTLNHNGPASGAATQHVGGVQLRSMTTTAYHQAGTVRCMALYAHYLYCGLWTGSVHVWNCGELHDNAIYEEPDRALQGHDRAVRAMVVHQGHLFTGSEDGLMCVWSVPKHELIKVVKVGHPVLALSIYKDHVFVNGKQEGVAAFYTTGAATSI